VFQFEASGPRHSPLPVPPPGGVSPKLTHRAFLAWGEHCQECAAPACYETCDLYHPTLSRKCRRFVDGIVRNRAGGPVPAAEIRFGRWAKLETQGNATMLPAREVERYEKFFARASAPIAHVGRAIGRLGGGWRWMVAEEVLHKRMNTRFQARSGGLRPDLFLAEITNPGDRTVALILTAFIDKRRMTRAIRADQLPPPAVARIEATPGFSRHELAVDAMRPVFDSGLPFNFSIVPEEDVPAGGEGAHLVFHRLDLGIREQAANTREATAAAAPAKDAKLVIFDLDNTLWRGVLLEGEVAPIDGLRDLFRTLDERGILLSVASKNAREDAMAKLAELGLAEYLLYPQIGWAPKSESVRRIVKAIDIGADTVLFIDDNPFERAEVAEAVAGVEVLPETAIPGLLSLPRLAGATTIEARTRRKMYQDAIAREEAAGEFGDDYLAFLATCEIRATIRRDRPEDMDRVAELVQRTNQLNFSGRKYKREEITAILADPARERYVIECEDKFGSYGTVGFCLAAREPAAQPGHDRLVIQDFMLSCRVQGKFIEQALVWTLAEAGPAPVSEVSVLFRQTERNKAAQMILDRLAFVPTEGVGYGRDYREADFAVPFLTVIGDPPAG
jgi:FkbH-like protein